MGALLSAFSRKSHFRFVFVPSFVYSGVVPSADSVSPHLMQFFTVTSEIISSGSRRHVLYQLYQRKKRD